MAKYTFIKEQDKENKFDVTRVQIDVDTVSLADVVEAFEEYLQACGFKFDGHLDFQDDEQSGQLSGIAQFNCKEFYV